MTKLPPTVLILAAIIIIIILGKSLEVIDLTLGTNLSSVSALWFAILTGVLFIAFIYYALKSRKKK